MHSITKATIHPQARKEYLEAEAIRFPVNLGGDTGEVGSTPSTYPLPHYARTHLVCAQVQFVVREGQGLDAVLDQVVHVYVCRETGPSRALLIAVRSSCSWWSKAHSLERTLEHYPPSTRVTYTPQFCKQHLVTPAGAAMLKKMVRPPL